jgi:hypothetical protein
LTLLAVGYLCTFTFVWLWCQPLEREYFCLTLLVLVCDYRGTSPAPRKERELGEPGLQRTMEALEASFEAALQRLEEAAADDLAFSLRQDSRLQVALSRGGDYHLHLAGVGSPKVAVVGPDFVGAGDPLELVAPSERAVVVGMKDTDRPAGMEARLPSTGACLLEILRGWARRGHRVELATAEDEFRGVLIRACPDHIALACETREVVAGMGAIRYVRRVLED